MAERLLDARGLHSYYGISHILHGIDFHVDEGEIVGLMGRNGMGKTTLLKTILGFVKPHSGTVRIRGQDMSGRAPHVIARAGIAYVPEGRGIFPNLSVRENLVMAARRGSQGRMDWDLAQVLNAFPRLAERLDQGGGQLSGGEQQMLTISRALLTNPDLIILDEATEGLAPLIAREIWAMLRALRERGVAVVVVDKNLKAVSALANRLVILLKGVAVFEGPATALHARPGLPRQYLGI